jgi:hypothetical protein
LQTLLLPSGPASNQSSHVDRALSGFGGHGSDDGSSGIIIAGGGGG